MAEFILKDRYGKEKTFDKETVYVRGTDGEVLPFTHGAGNPVLEPLTITENGTYTAPAGVDGYNPVTVLVDPTKVTILKEQEISGFEADPSFGYSLTDFEPTYTITEGETYLVAWDGVTYETKAVSADSFMEGALIMGNGSPLGLPGNDEPFAIGAISGAVAYIAFEDASVSHTVGIWQKVKTEFKLQDITVEENGKYTADADYDGLGEVTVAVPAPEVKLQDKTITENGEYTADSGFDGLGKVTVDVASSGSSSADVRYVTFMSYDGAVEYGKKAVAVGDDCADPIARGIFTTPTRESDAQYNYTFYGWATTPNGAADANALKAVEEDKTVYANFASAVRYYTITYYDSDGTTVLKTESLAYGSMPSYTPTKDGYMFGDWTPVLATVTGNASYIANWAEKLTFAKASWADIARISEAGEASEYFAVGDQKTIPFVFSGTTINVNAKIIGLNHDNLANGSGKAGISVCLVQTIDNAVFNVTESTASGNSYIWENSATRTLLNSGEVFTAIPAELRNVIKSVKKISNGGNGEQYGGHAKNALYETTDKIWLLSSTEIGLDNAYPVEHVALGQGQVYEYFATDSTTKRMIKSTNNKNINYATRSMQSQYNGSSVCVSAYNGAAASGKLGYGATGLRSPSVFGFCI